MTNSFKNIASRLSSDEMPKWVPYVALALLAIGLLAFNHVIELRAAEARRALVTFEMMQSDSLLVPQLHGYDYYNKPPFYNWVLCFFFTITGSFSESIVRLPGILSLLGTAALVYWSVKKYIDKAWAVLAAGIFLTLGDMLFYGSVNAGEIDLFYALLTFAQILCIFHFFEKAQWWKLFLFSYLLMAVGVLTKGVPSIAFQGLTLLAYFLYKRSFWKLFSIQHILSFCLSVSLVSVYFYLYSQEGDVVGYLINTFKQASQRSANVHSALSVVLNLAVYPFFLWQKLLPWSLALFLLVSKDVRTYLKTNRFTAFLILFTAANILVYWTSPQHVIRYTYMFFPVAAILFIVMIAVEKPASFRMGPWIKYIFQYAILILGIALTAVPPFVDLFTVFQTTICIIIGLSLISIFLMSRKWQGHQFYWSLILTLAIARMGYNLVGMPITVDRLPKYEEMTLSMIEKTNGKPIHYYGDMVDIHPRLHLAGHTYYDYPLLIPEDLTADFAYYEMTNRERVMDMQTTITPGSFYLLYENDLKKNLIVLDTFPNMMGGNTMYFCEGAENQ